MLDEVPGRDAGGTAAVPVESYAGRVGRVIGERMSKLRGLVGRHRLFALALGLSVVPRVIVMLGFQPAILFKLDSYDYLWNSVHLTPNPVNTSGYSLLLWVMRPFHSLAVIAGLQHLLGLCIAVLVYAVLRRWGVRQWIATLAAAPVLFSPSQFLLEQLIMADLLALFLMVAGFAVLLLRFRPSPLRSGVAGLLMGASVVVRPTTLPLIVLMAAYLLVRRNGWRSVCAVLACGALPVVAYMSWFDAANGSFNLTNSNGIFLWSRTMSFADCAVIKPPADLQALCPERQPLTLKRPAGAGRLLPKRYLWDHRAWQWQPPVAGLVPDTSAFTAANNSRALRFAIRAIEAQPLAYASTIGKESLKPFAKQIGFVFPRAPYSTSGLTGQNRRYAVAALTAYLGSAHGITPLLGSHLGERIVEPYAHLIRGYQRVIFLPEPLFALILVAGFAGLLIPRRRSAAAAMLWLSAGITLLLPIAEHEYNYRYALPAIPLACMAAALAVRTRPHAVRGDPAPAVAADDDGLAAPDGGRAASPRQASGAPAPEFGSARKPGDAGEARSFPPAGIAQRRQVRTSGRGTALTPARLAGLRRPHWGSAGLGFGGRLAAIPGSGSLSSAHVVL